MTEGDYTGIKSYGGKKIFVGDIVWYNKKRGRGMKAYKGEVRRSNKSSAKIMICGADGQEDVFFEQENFLIIGHVKK